LREPKRKIINPDKMKETKQVIPNTNDWTNIPYYPTTRERRENMAKSMISQGKQVPQDLLNQIENDKLSEVKNDIYNQTIVQNTQTHTRPPPPPQHHNQQQIRLQPPPNKYSPEYARYIGHKPKESSSARIQLGGVY
jgi:hypothetical protein